MQVNLVAHPQTASLRNDTIVVDVQRHDDRLTCSFTLPTWLDPRAMPGPAVRTDGLWRHSCFEAFVAGAGAGYCEFNFAPSGAWAAYAFDDYRAGMRDAEAAPVVGWDGRMLTAAVAVDIPGDWRLNLSAVIEEIDRTKTYWALAHPDGPPDFHDPACFVLEVPAVG